MPVLRTTLASLGTIPCGMSHLSQSPCAQAIHQHPRASTHPPIGQSPLPLTLPRAAIPRPRSTLHQHTEEEVTLSGGTMHSGRGGALAVEHNYARDTHFELPTRDLSRAGPSCAPACSFAAAHSHRRFTRTRARCSDRPANFLSCVRLCAYAPRVKRSFRL